MTPIEITQNEAVKDHDLFEETYISIGRYGIAQDNNNDKNQHWGYSGQQNRKQILSLP